MPKFCKKDKQIFMDKKRILLALTDENSNSVFK